MIDRYISEASYDMVFGDTKNEANRIVKELMNCYSFTEIALKNMMIVHIKKNNVMPYGKNTLKRENFKKFLDDNIDNSYIYANTNMDIDKIGLDCDGVVDVRCGYEGYPFCKAQYTTIGNYRLVYRAKGKKFIDEIYVENQGFISFDEFLKVTQE